ncbi:hypothetical protein [Ensifer canadensis]
MDENRAMGQFVLAGSSNVFISAHVADSLRKIGMVRNHGLEP